MKLTEHFEINIPKKKISGYLLSSTHKLGSLKAAYFKTYGFSSDDVDEFLSEIKSLVKSNEVSNEIKNIHGTTYLVDGKIKVARFITAYPK